MSVETKLEPDDMDREFAKAVAPAAATVGVETLEGVIRGLADGTFYGYAIVAVGPDKAFSSWATATNRTELLGLVNVVADRIVSNINDDTGDD